MLIVFSDPLFAEEAPPFRVSKSDISAATSTIPTIINLNTCQQDMYCVSLGGSVFNQILPVRLDTAAAALSMPESCLTAGNYEVLAENVLDEFQEKSDLVKANVSIMNDTAKAITLKGFVFYAIKDVECKNKDGAYGNFGAAMNYIKHASNDCVASYFNYITALNKPDTRFGLTILEGKTLLLGPIQRSIPYYEQAPYFNLQCGGILQGIPSFSTYSLDQGWPGPLMDGFNITINQISVPVTPSNTLGPQPITKLAQIDSGGGLMIIADNNDGDIRTAFSAITIPCEKIVWLDGCDCVEANQPVIVSATKYDLQYNYTTTSYNQDLRRAIAICPPGGETPYVSPNSANLGYQLFSHGTVIFDYKNGAIGFDGFKK